MSRVLKTLLVALVLLSAYNLLWLGAPSMIGNRHFNSSWWQENYIKIQDYLYKPAPYEVVLSGSSLMERLPLEPFGPRACNLGLVGYSPLTVLQCIERSGRYPRVIVIEANWLDRPVNGALVDHNLDDPMRTLRRIFPGLRESNQPANALAELFSRYVYPLNPERAGTIQQRTEGFYRERLAFNVSEQELGANRPQMIESLRQIARLISDFRTRGVRVFLVDLPIDPVLQKTRRVREMRTALEQVFPSASGLWLPAYPNPAILTTVDGFHLTSDSSSRYAIFLDQCLEAVLPPPS